MCHLRLVTVDEFIACNGSTPITTVRGFSPWRTCVYLVGKFFVHPLRCQTLAVQQWALEN